MFFGWVVISDQYLFQEIVTACSYHCHVRVLGWIYTLYLPECQGIPCSKKAWCVKFKWMQPQKTADLVIFTEEIFNGKHHESEWDSNTQPLNSETNTQPFSQTDQFG